MTAAQAHLNNDFVYRELMTPSVIGTHRPPTQDNVTESNYNNTQTRHWLQHLHLSSTLLCRSDGDKQAKIKPNTHQTASLDKLQNMLPANDLTMHAC